MVTTGIDSKSKIMMEETKVEQTKVRDETGFGTSFLSQEEEIEAKLLIKESKQPELIESKTLSSNVGIESFPESEFCRFVKERTDEEKGVGKTNIIQYAKEAVEDTVEALKTTIQEAHIPEKVIHVGEVVKETFQSAKGTIQEAHIPEKLSNATHNLSELVSSTKPSTEEAKATEEANPTELIIEATINVEKVNTEQESLTKEKLILASIPLVPKEEVGLKKEIGTKQESIPNQIPIPRITEMEFEETPETGLRSMGTLGKPREDAIVSPRLKNVICPELTEQSLKEMNPCNEEQQEKGTIPRWIEGTKDIVNDTINVVSGVIHDKIEEMGQAKEMIGNATKAVGETIQSAKEKVQHIPEKIARMTGNTIGGDKTAMMENEQQEEIESSGEALQKSHIDSLQREEDIKGMDHSKFERTKQVLEEELEKKEL